MKDNKIFITKMSGETALFDEQKLRQSLTRSGAGEAEIQAILEQVKSRLYEGIKTKTIYKIAFSLLKKKSKTVASRYKLKRAIFELGPTGFPFEIYMAELFKHQGYTITVGSFLQGHCVKHEVDVIAEKDNGYLMMECKFHSEQGQFCAVKNSLYVNARFRDIERRLAQDPGFDNRLISGGLVTNTRFTADALQFGVCMNMHMLSWDYPKGKGLKDLIDRFQLYPITTLMSITNYEKKSLLDKGIILCKQLPANTVLLQELNFTDLRIAKIMADVMVLCGNLSEVS